MTRPDATIRVFIALAIPPETRQVLVETRRRLGAAIPSGVRWVDPPGIHLTLKFLGNIDPHLVDNLLEAMRRSAQGSSPFRLQLSGLGLFPNAREPRVLLVGVAGDLDPLRGLQDRVEEAVVKLGFPRESRPFSPHLTLGRVHDRSHPDVRERVRTSLSATTLEPSDLWQVKAVHLIHSTLTSAGAVYTILGSVPL